MAGAEGDAARVRGIFDATIALHEKVGRGDVAPVVRAAAVVRAAHQAGAKLLIFGNGGSATDAEHMACEIVNRFQREREALAALALTDSSILTAVANDYSFDRVFARQIEGLGRRGDVALGISTSGNSPSVVRGLEAARDRGLATIALTGRDGGAIGRLADVHVNVPGESTARIQEVHRTLIHAICELIEG